ncbi:SGNH/GDSL hydrolase family protein [Paenibacillus sp. GCM10027627]|uniref:SGNH/GDSL hydrolase family protein n=1 Tax=unclassified Paenibacillus TaxID=185978 RepID=UPI0036402524
MLLAKGDKIVMIGDSITDCERARPVGEGLFGAIGNGYVSLVDAMLQSIYPELAVRVVNMGVSGNTVRDLKERWEKDVFEQNPDWVSIMIGINDVWRQYDLPLQKESHVYLDEYEAALRGLIAETKPRVKGIVLMTPFYIEPSQQDRMRTTMDEYGAVVKALAEEYDTLFVDTQAAFAGLLETIYPAALAWDRIHPNTAGHMAIANAFLRTIGFLWK